MSTALEDAKQDMSKRTVWSLARLAGCGDPDSSESAGALFLTGIRDVVVDEYDPEDPDSDERWHEAADSAISVYTHSRWQQFVDLQAYAEDPTELGFDGTDMLEGAAACLYLIGYRLASLLWEELNEAANEDDEDEEV